MALGKNLTKKITTEKPAKAKQEQALSTAQPEIIPDRSEAKEEVFTSYEQFCVFSTGSEEYALPIHIVKEVVKLPTIAKVPQMPDYLIGMANVRGNIYGIMDLSIFFRGDDEKTLSDYRYLIVLDHDEYKMGIIIHDVPDTVSIPKDAIEKLSSSTMKSIKGRKYLQGIIRKDKRMIILFDILEMISSSKFTEVMD